MDAQRNAVVAHGDGIGLLGRMRCCQLRMRSSFGVCLQADFNLSYAQLGLLPALYMAGLMVACLVFNELTNHVNSFRLVGKAQEYIKFCSQSRVVPPFNNALLWVTDQGTVI